MKKQTLALAIAALIVAASTMPVMAYTLLSPRRRWRTTPVTVLVNNTGNSTITDSDRGVTAVVGAIKAWNIVSSSSTSSSAVRGTPPPIIMLHTNGNICTGSCLAATLTGYYHSEGSSTYIDDADVYTNQRFDYTSSREGDGCSGEYECRRADQRKKPPSYPVEPRSAGGDCLRENKGACRCDRCSDNR